MAKKLKKQKQEQTIEALAANFDRAQFDQLVLIKEAKLHRAKINRGTHSNIETIRQEKPRFVACRREPLKIPTLTQSL